jgi:AsmA protein
MPRILKRVAIAFAAVLGLLVLAAIVIAATFNPNDYKDTVIKAVQEKTGRSLAIPGELKLTFFPRLGAQLGKVSLSDKGGPAEFVGVDSAHVSLALLPLLAKNVVVDRIDVVGLRANVVRNADGSMSFDDLMAKPGGPAKEGGGSKVKFAIDGVNIRQSVLHLDDRKEGRKVDLAVRRLESGPIGSKLASKLVLEASMHVDKPGLTATLEVNSGFKLDLEARRLTLDQLDARMTGAITAANRLDLAVKGAADVDLVHGDLSSSGLHLTTMYAFAGRTINARLDLPAFKSVAKQLKLPGLVLAFDIDDVKAQLKAKASLAGNVSLDLEAMRLAAPELALALDGSKGGHALAAKFNVGLNADQAKQTLGATLKGKLDDSTIDARLGLRNFAAPAIEFALSVDKIDVDRYRSPPALVPSTSPGQQGAAGPEAVIDLSALKGLQVNGGLKIGGLRAGGLQLSNLAAEVRSSGTRFAVNPMSARLYGGSLNGSLNLEFSASDKAPNIALDQNLTGIELGPLLKDVMQKAPIDGKGDVQLSVATRGNTVSQMKRALGGSAHLRLADGSVSGFNLAKIVRDAKAKLSLAKGNAPSTGTAAVQDKTDFTELSASFKIANGVAHNDDLAAKTPLFRLGGAGDIDLGKDRLDYLAKCTVVATLAGQGGPELDALRGITVPVRLSGPFTSVGWHIDVKSMVSDTVKQKAQDKVKDKLKDALKGLFGK